MNFARPPSWISRFPNQILLPCKPQVREESNVIPNYCLMNFSGVLMLFAKKKKVKSKAGLYLSPFPLRLNKVDINLMC